MTYKKVLGLSLLISLPGCENPGKALYQAADRCDTEAVKRLLSKEALAYRDRYGDSAAQMAATCREDFSALKAILEYQPDMIFTESNRGSTPLSSAFGPNDYEKVRYLLDMGSEVPHYEHDKYGCTGLMERAVGNSAEPTIRLLIERGADVTAASFYDALHSADASVVSLLLPRLHPQIVNKPDSLDEFPLEIAINHSKSDVLRVLLEAGARTDIRFKNGKTPLEHAKAAGDMELIKTIEDFAVRP